LFNSCTRYRIQDIVISFKKTVKIVTQTLLDILDGSSIQLLWTRSTIQTPTTSVNVTKFCVVGLISLKPRS